MPLLAQNLQHNPELSHSVNRAVRNAHSSDDLAVKPDRVSCIQAAPEDVAQVLLDCRAGHPTAPPFDQPQRSSRVVLVVLFPRPPLLGDRDHPLL